jgi:putative endonuclease
MLLVLRRPTPSHLRTGPELRDDRGRVGLLGELAARWFLRAAGWSVVARGRRVGGVQVDLVARRGAVDALVEVKTRRGPRPPGAPEMGHLVAPDQLVRLRRAALAWQGRLAEAGSERVVRIDVLEVRWNGARSSIRLHQDVGRLPE